MKGLQELTYLGKALSPSHYILLVQSFAAFHLIPPPTLLPDVFSVEPHTYSFLLLSTILEMLLGCSLSVYGQEF
jgi:hypothetical protein